MPAPIKAEDIRKLLRAGKKAKAEEKFGKRAVAQEARRMAAKAKKQKEQAAKLKSEAKATSKKQSKIAKSSAGAEGARRATKKTRQQKAEAAFKKSEEKRKSLKEVQGPRPKPKTVKDKKTQAKLDAEMKAELEGKTPRSRRERIKAATKPKDRRRAKKLTQGRESDEAFEARMSREARAGGVEDVGRRRSQRGSARDPLFDYERSQANRLLRGQDQAPMTVDDMIKMYEGRKAGGGIQRGMGAALRGGGKVRK